MEQGAADGVAASEMERVVEGWKQRSETIKNRKKARTGKQQKGEQHQMLQAENSLAGAA